MKLLMEQWKQFVEAAGTEKQKRFMHAVEDCKEDGDCPSGEIKKAAGSMTTKQVKDYTTKPVKEELDSHEDKKGNEVASAHQSELDAATKLKQIEEMVRQELEERCWKGYEETPGVEDYADGSCRLQKEELDEAELEEAFDKDKMKCNSARYLKKGDTGYGKKQKVVKACKDGKEKIVKFGDANMENKSDNPKNKADFNSRHDCKNKKDKFTAGYWSCKDW